MGPDDIKKAQERRNKLFKLPCTKCGGGPIHQINEEKGTRTCLSCFIKEVQKMNDDLRNCDFVVG